MENLIYFEKEINVGHRHVSFDVFCDNINKIKEEYSHVQDLRITWEHQFGDILFSINGYTEETQEETQE